MNATNEINQVASEKSFERADNNNHNNTANSEFKDSGNSIWVMSSQRVYLTKVFLDRLIEKQLTNTGHILSPETDICPSWISRYEKMTVENISWLISMKECCWPCRYQTHDLLIINRVHIQLSHRSWPKQLQTTDHWSSCKLPLSLVN